MQVLIDMTHITIDKLYVSLSVYVFRLLDAMNSDERQRRKLLIRPEMEDYIKEKYSDCKYTFFNAPRKALPKNRIKRIIIQTKEFKRAINQSNCDIVLITSDLHPYTIIKTKIPKIVVIHDLKAIKKGFGTMKDKIFRIFYFFFYFFQIKHANAIVAISKYTKQDIKKYFSFAKLNPTYVIYNSVDITESATKPKCFPENIKYILYVNTLQKYKNIITLIQAYRQIKEQFNLKLVIVGKKTRYWETTILKYISKKHLESSIIQLQNITNEELRYIYENADLFVTPSLREGFGYTPIEAAIYKCPVICSTSESLPDITMNRLIYYSPANDVSALKDKITQTLLNPPTKQELADNSTVFRNTYSREQQKIAFFKLFSSLSKKTEL